MTHPDYDYEEMADRHAEWLAECEVEVNEEGWELVDSSWPVEVAR